MRRNKISKGRLLRTPANCCRRLVRKYLQGSRDSEPFDDWQKESTSYKKRVRRDSLDGRQFSSQIKWGTAYVPRPRGDPVGTPRSHPVTIAMIVHFHARNLPAGPRALISIVVKKRVLHASESDRVCFNTSWLSYRRRGWLTHHTLSWSLD